jgi:hypothetical protein
VTSRPERGPRKQEAQRQREKRHMTNQHAGLSQTLAEQRITERHEQATQARLVRGTRPSRRRRRRAWLRRRLWQLAQRPGVATDQPVSRRPTVS